MAVRPRFGDDLCMPGRRLRACSARRGAEIVYRCDLFWLGGVCQKRLQAPRKATARTRVSRHLEPWISDILRPSNLPKGGRNEGKTLAKIGDLRPPSDPRLPPISRWVNHADPNSPRGPAVGLRAPQGWRFTCPADWRDPVNAARRLWDPKRSLAEQLVRSRFCPTYVIRAHAVERLSRVQSGRSPTNVSTDRGRAGGINF